MSIWFVAALTYALGFGAIALRTPDLFVVVLAPILIAPFFGLWRGVRKHQRRWTAPLPPVEVGGTGAYRGQAVIPGYRAHIPLRVRLASLSCFCFGVQFVPGLALGVGGLFAGGLGVLSIPGLFVAHGLWRAGRSILEASPLSLAQADRAARLAQMLNVVIVAGSGLGVIWSLAADSRELLYFTLGLLGLAAAALFQSLWVAKVVASIEPRDYAV